jgi:DNA polymerase-1
MDKTLMILDINNLLYRGFYATPNLQFKGRRTGGLFGFTNMLCKYINKHKPYHILATLDSPPYKRKGYFPAYKENRKRDSTPQEAELYASLNFNRNLILELLKILDIPVLQEKGFESDDLIYEICLSNLLYKKIIICSTDDDLYSLLLQANRFINIEIEKSSGIYTKEDFLKEYGITYQISIYIEKKLIDIWEFARIVGGDHNGIPPIIRGIGKKKAIKIFQDPNKRNCCLTENKEEIEERLKFMLFPIEKRFGVNYLYAIPKPDIGNFERLLGKYGIESKLSFKNALEYLITLRMKETLINGEEFLKNT